jgi:Mg-chelatase subunit ChlD
MQEQQRRWRLILGENDENTDYSLSPDDSRIDRALSDLYNNQEDRKGGLGNSAPNLNRWLGDIRKYFPTDVVQLMQHDAIDRLNLKELLFEPEILETLVPDVQLVSTLINFNKAIPDNTRETARMVVRKLVQEVEQKLAVQMRQSITGALNRAVRNYRPKLREIDWNRTIRANLKNYIQAKKTVIAEKLVGYGYKSRTLKDIIICVDQSASMAGSVVYAGILAAVMASIRTISTHLIVFDTTVVDLTPELIDPVEVLFGTMLGGGTDINRAVAYCQNLISRPEHTIFILISDLYEGGNHRELISRAAQMVHSGVNFIVLLALNDEGVPAYDKNMAANFAALNIPSFACTPNLFAELIAAAILKEDMQLFCSKHELKIGAVQISNTDI